MSEWAVSDIDNLKRDLERVIRKHSRWVYGQPARELKERWSDDKRAIMLPYQLPDDSEMTFVAQSSSQASEDLWSITVNTATDEARQLANKIKVEIADQPADAETGEPAKDSEPRVPSRAADLRKWQATWELIEGQVRKGRTAKDIGDWLFKTHEELPSSPSTVRKIIAAGEAGSLDE